MSHPLSAKVALVTGAGRGIGRAIALRLAQDGAAVNAPHQLRSIGTYIFGGGVVVPLCLVLIGGPSLLLVAMLLVLLASLAIRL